MVGCLHRRMQPAAAAAPPRKRFPWIIYAIVLLLILLAAFAPVISVAIAGAVAEAHGCTLHEGFKNPCLINGVDYGDTLYTMGVLGWFMLATLPIGAFACFIWAVILIVHLVSRRRGQPNVATAATAFLLMASLPVLAQSPSPKMSNDDLAMALRAAGTFDVKLEPKPNDSGGEAKTPARMTITKTFHGDLDATSSGQMLSAMTETKGSAGYVAIEQVSGTLSGRKGTFVLQHNGIMDRGDPRLSVIVVPDSGTEELVGLTGEMTIKVEGAKHSYEFTYRFVRKD